MDSELPDGSHPLSYRVFPNVRLGRGVWIGEAAIIGQPPRGSEAGTPVTTLGDGAVVRSHTVIYSGNSIGANFQTGHGVLVRESNQIEDDVSVGSHTVIEHHVRIGRGVRVHSNAFICEFTILEDGAWIGPCVVFTNALYPLSRNAKETLRGVHVMKNARIGANATILPGLVLGEGCLVGAGAVVTKDVPPGKVVAGNPARVINDIANLPYDQR